MKIQSTLFLLLILSSQLAFSKWEPPANPDPEKILREAGKDVRANNYKIALDKHVWFHNNALKFRQSLYGVRLSFALSDWLDLANKYEPAMMALKNTRDLACENAKKNISIYANYHDCASINRKLNENHISVDIFKWLDKHHSVWAKGVYNLAQKYLILSKEYSLCGKYLKPRAAYDKNVRDYHRSIDSFNSGTFKEFDAKSLTRFRNYAHDSFLKRSAIIIALLVHNDKEKEAKIYYEEAITESFPPNSKIILGNALKGGFPVLR